jgi:uncharacterized YigZ family protein
LADPSSSYRVLGSACSAELREKGSRFLALLHPVATEDAAGRLRERLAAEHRDASHYCWAQRIGWPPRERSSDAGEPRGTAGEPIARVLRAGELSDVLAVVIRWFGGTRLGKGGLARAYSRAVSAALEDAVLDTRHATARLRLVMPYGKVGAVKRLIRSGEIDWLDEEYGAEVAAGLRVRLELVTEVLSALADLRVEAEVLPEDHS